MKTIKAFVERHPVATYFALVFAISWGGVLVVVGPGELSATPGVFAFLTMLAGPSVAGILLTGLLYGRAGFRDLLARMRRWRVGARWYAVALLTAPLLYVAVSLVLSLFSPEYLPGIFVTDDKAALVLFGIAWGVAVGFLEELGWTGFAIPRLRPRHGVLVTGLIVGVLWGAWHLLVNVLAIGSASGGLPPAIYLPAILFSLLVGSLPVYRVLMVWVYDRTESLLVAMLMHASLTASQLTLNPLATGTALLTYGLVSAAVLWVVVAVVGEAGGGQLSQQPPLRRRVA